MSAPTTRITFEVHYRRPGRDWAGYKCTENLAEAIAIREELLAQPGSAIAKLEAKVVRLTTTWHREDV